MALFQEPSHSREIRDSRLGDMVSSLAATVSRLGAVQLQHGSRIGKMESFPQDNTHMLGKLLEDLRRDILESRQEILDCFGKEIQVQSHWTRIQNGWGSKNGWGSAQGSIDLDNLGGPWQQDLQKDLREMKQTLTSIQQDIHYKDLYEMKQTLTSIQQDIQSLTGAVYNGTGTKMSSNTSQISISTQNPPHGDAGEEEQGSLAQTIQQKKNKLMQVHGAPQLWAEFDAECNEYDPDNTYDRVLERRVGGKGFWHSACHVCGHGEFLPTEMPNIALAHVTQSHFFTTLQTLLILSNTIFMGYETDVTLRAILKDPPEKTAEWMTTANHVYNIVFTVELLFRIIALRGWFWVAGHDWPWNLFDVVLVSISLVSDWLLTGVNVSFIRMLRILRVVRVARVIRVLRAFRQLRQMLFSVIACLSSLAWAFVFLVMVMFMFSVLFLQGITNTLSDLEDSDLSVEHRSLIRDEIRLWFGSLDSAMLSLLASVTGGTDWLTIKQPLDHAGWVYGAAFIAYLLFVTVGVMNVLTGVFLSSADDFFDLDLMGQCEQVKVEGFISQMLQLYNEIDLSHTGQIDWPTFSEALKNQNLRAFLASMKLEPTHIRLIFDLLDEKRSGSISMRDFVMSMVKLRGEAKAIDARIIQREISMIPMLLGK
mmetsp:Transcript_35708/g.66345  ORF Transcript_35708/g.66345 Transcript_35708/m.66345 type:complete len:651 (-) Transcript_35708:102-2054(-)